MIKSSQMVEKEADKIAKQITGSSDIEARNKQLMALEACS